MMSRDDVTRALREDRRRYCGVRALQPPPRVTAMDRSITSTFLLLFLLFLLLLIITAGSACHTAVDSRDLGCLLRWDCPAAGPKAVYTVQTKTQGGPWQDVAWCVWISSQTCDLSQAFSHFDLYNMIRLGIHDDGGAGGSASTVWTEPQKFDYSDFTFSAPSVSLSLAGARLRVRVQFPCAASRRCSGGICCPVSQLIDPWTSVTLYTPLSPSSDHQRRTVWSQEAVLEVDFAGLAPGQHYCAVANFSFPSYAIAASPPSAPRCVDTDRPAGLQPWMVGVVLCFVLMAPIFILFLLKTKRRAARPSPERRPKMHRGVILGQTQASPQDNPTLTPPPSSLPVVECDLDPCDLDPCDLDPCDRDPCDLDPCDLDPCDRDPCDLDPCDLDPCDVHLELIDDHLVFLGSSSPGDLWKLRVLLQPGGYSTAESMSGSAWFWGGSGGGLEPGPDPGPHSRDRGPDCESLI
ncbi:unnamed protein product [Merluccius merluccius]